jgi:hypothetical protein
MLFESGVSVKIFLYRLYNRDYAQLFIVLPIFALYLNLWGAQPT